MNSPTSQRPAASPYAPLGQIIEQKRKDKGMTRAALAKFAGISPNSMVKYEKAGEADGKYPSMVNMAKIAEILEFDPRKIFECIANTEAIRRNPDFSFMYTFKDLENEWTGEHNAMELQGIGYEMEKVFEALTELRKEIAQLKGNKNEKEPGKV
ncbi:helix-turn-helix transcriptional regulator [Sneathiella sp. HT1-7]|uniref:helix-turn-helix transcriptional regulator n=1 Tax=Sneathiella sp. HT1-7 TaxID=2887192 RepID=UPI001D149C39|nr:helix-turn-helix transcriptional regulator [Sneathiella sp. HT1-7]